MLIFINYETKEIQGDKKVITRKNTAVKLSDIKRVSAPYLSQIDHKIHYRITVENEEFYSTSFSDMKTAEMAQLSTVSILNALELYYDRFKHVPEHHATPVGFRAVDLKTQKLIPGKVSICDQIIYTVTI